MNAKRPLRALAAALALLSCDDDEAPGPGPQASEPEVTYHRDVAPLLARRCVSCHQPGQIAPFVLTSHAQAAPLAQAMAEAARKRTMPPFPVDNGGACGEFHDARWMSEEEIATLERWRDLGAPEGASRPPPSSPEPRKLSGRVISLDSGVHYAPDTSQPDDYRCFLVDVQADEEELFVTGFDVHPGEARLVHHVIVYHPTSDDAAEQARALDTNEAGPGYTCFGTSGVLAAAVAAWAPGGGATFYPDNTGIRIRPTRPLILQMHYNTQAGPGLSDRSRVDLQVVAGGVQVGRFAPVVDLGLRLPPRQELAEAGATMAPKLPSGPSRIFGVFPHMHTLGKTLRLEVERADASRSCVVDVPRWDFHWQSIYFHKNPIPFSPGDKLSIRCTYDTRSRSEETRWGEGTADEMCVAGVFLVP